jgi:hypothetical protein
MRDIHILILSMRLHGPEMTLTDLTYVTTPMVKQSDAPLLVVLRRLTLKAS